jgi:hypothetical protein
VLRHGVGPIQYKLPMTFAYNAHRGNSKRSRLHYLRSETGIKKHLRSDTCSGADTEEDRGERDEDTWGIIGRLPTGGSGLMPGMLMCQWRQEAATGPDPMRQRWSDFPVAGHGDSHGRRRRSLGILMAATGLV